MASKFPSTDLPKLKDTEDDTAVKKSILDLLDKINTVSDSAYPVGATYTQYSGQTAPASLFGGTWTDITATSLPTQVYDSGSNANGLWIRYTDGTMMQYGQTSVSVTTTALGPVFRALTTISLALSFVNTSFSLSFFVDGNTISAWGGSYDQVTTSSVRAFVYAATAGTATVTIYWQAIGKWSSAPVYPVTLWKRTGGSLATTTGTSVVTGIYDSGTNSNGSWIRFTDGTMICWGYNISISVGVNQGFTANYPINFTNDYSTGQTFTYSLVSNAGNYPTSYVGNGYPTTSQSLVVYTIAGSLCRITWQAIGKWK